MTKRSIFIIPLLLFSHYLHAATVTWSPTDNTIDKDTTFSLDIVGLNFVGDVDGGGVNVSFDPNVIHAVSVEIDTTVWNLGPTAISTGTINNVTGSIDGIMVNTFAYLTGDFTVATVTFKTVGNGGSSSNLTLSELVINPWASAGSRINPAFINGSITIPDTDSDGDGVNDSADNCLSIANPAQTDTDSDGMGNACDSDDDNDGLSDTEENVLGTNPLLADTDNDGANDSIDAFPNDANETSDTDSDTVGDNADNCPAVANTNQLNTDGDAEGDACDNDDDNDGLTDTEENTLGTNPLLADSDNDSYNDNVDVFPLDNTEWLDSDNDTIGDNSDNCPNFANIDQLNTDGDTQGDVCDNDDDNDGLSDTAESSLGTNPLLADTDNDGVNDGIDAFPTDPTKTTMITDTDGDGVGDDTDAFPNDASETSDSDSDSVGDNGDNCPNIANTNQLNTDGDAQGDACDNDDDNDGLSDTAESSLGTNPLLADTDNDSYNDNVDLFPLDNTEWLDSDGDGVGDNADAFPYDASETIDTDNDGIGNNSDAFPYDSTETVDTDGDNVGDNADAFPDNIAASVDVDNDGKPDEWNINCDTTCQNNSGLTLDSADTENSDSGSISATLLGILLIIGFRRRPTVF